MMRITNAMMTSNTKNNININKVNEDNLNSQMATGQKILRPSDDPVIAIRALRLNTNLSQLNQFYDKNIPDASAWMKVTETALSQTDAIFTSIKENLTTGASDTNTATDRQKILTSLKSLRDEIYSSGNADYAERTVFTGYRTGESLTYLETDDDLNHNFMIHQTFELTDIDTQFDYITTFDGSDSTKQYEQTVESYKLNRLRLPYDMINSAEGDSSQLVLKDDAGATTNITVTTRSIDGLSQGDIDDIYTNVPDGEAVLIPETGEIILGNGAMSTITGITNLEEISFEYNKNTWQSGDLRPEHYFACVDTTDSIYFNYELDPLTGDPDPTKPNFQNQNMEIEISFNQKITINTHADEVYSHDIGRGIDDLIMATSDVVELEKKIDDLERKVSLEGDPTLKAELQNQLDATNKEFSLKKDKMQRMFSKAIDIYEGFSDKNNIAIANIGSMQARLAITKERVSSQLQSFKELANDNINASVSDTAIDLKSAELALEAAQLAASKIAQQTLLNYL